MSVEPTHTVRLQDLGPLHDLLLGLAPTAQEVGIATGNPERRSIRTLARKLGLTPWAVYVWIKKGKLPAARASELVALFPDRVTLEQLHPFVYS